jgi:hypothetical protein
MGHVVQYATICDGLQKQNGSKLWPFQYLHNSKFPLLNLILLFASDQMGFVYPDDVVAQSA